MWEVAAIPITEGEVLVALVVELELEVAKAVELTMPVRGPLGFEVDEATVVVSQLDSNLMAAAVLPSNTAKDPDSTVVPAATAGYPGMVAGSSTFVQLKMAAAEAVAAAAAASPRVAEPALVVLVEATVATVIAEAGLPESLAEGSDDLDAAADVGASL